MCRAPFSLSLSKRPRILRLARERAQTLIKKRVDVFEMLDCTEIVRKTYDRGDVANFAILERRGARQITVLKIGGQLASRGRAGYETLETMPSWRGRFGPSRVRRSDITYRVVNRQRRENPTLQRATYAERFIDSAFFSKGRRDALPRRAPRRTQTPELRPAPLQPLKIGAEQRRVPQSWDVGAQFLRLFVLGDDSRARQLERRVTAAERLSGGIMRL